MARIEEQAVIDAAPAAAFDDRLDFAANLARYNPSVLDVRQVGGDGPGPGAVYPVRVRLGLGITATAHSP